MSLSKSLAIQTSNCSHMGEQTLAKLSSYLGVLEFGGAALMTTLRSISSFFFKTYKVLQEIQDFQISSYKERVHKLKRNFCLVSSRLNERGGRAKILGLIPTIDNIIVKIDWLFSVPFFPFFSLLSLPFLLFHKSNKKQWQQKLSVKLGRKLS